MTNGRRLTCLAISALMVAGPSLAFAEDTVKVGLIMEMSGPFASFGRNMMTGVEIYQKLNGTSVAGKKVEVILKDVGGPNPEIAKRLAQELIVRDKVSVIAGFGFTPNALAVAPLLTQAKIPGIVMNASAIGLTEKSPYLFRVSQTIAQNVPPIAVWAYKKGLKKAYTIVADYAPGYDAEKAFIDAFKKQGGEIIGSVRAPLNTLDFGPYMQRIKEAKPDALYAFVNGGDVAPSFYRAFVERDMAKAGITLIGPGDITDESVLNDVGDRALGVVTSYPYSMHHDSQLNRKFVKAYKEAMGANNQATLFSVSGYDAMSAIYMALKKTNGNAGGEQLAEALRGIQLESPRGMISIDPNTRDIVQDIYYREVKQVNGTVGNIEFGKAER